MDKHEVEEHASIIRLMYCRELSDSDYDTLCHEMDLLISEAASEAEALNTQLSACRSECDQLRAEWHDVIERMHAQARQIEAARHAIQWIYERYTELIESGDCGSWDVYAEPCVIECEQWLAANAPEPAPENEQPALLTEDGYFTNWPTVDEMPALEND